MKSRALRGAAWVYLVAAAGMALLALDPFSLGMRLRGMSPAAAELIQSLIYYVPFVLLPCALWAANREQPLTALCVDRPAVRGYGLRSIVIGLSLILTAELITYGWYIALEALGADPASLSVGSLSYESLSELRLDILSTAVVAPVAEELLFRGALLTAMRETLGTRRAVLLSSLLFALLHVSPVGFPCELLCGIALAVLAISAESLYASIMAHTVYNAGILMLSYVAADTGVDAAAGGEVVSSSVTPDIILIYASCVLLTLLLLVRSYRRYLRRNADADLTRTQPHLHRDLIPAYLGIVLLVLLYALVFLVSRA